MPSIPYESQVDARTGRGSGARFQNPYDANAFGGDGLSRAGEAVGQAADALQAEADRKVKEQSVYYRSMANPTEALDKVKQTMDPDATGYTDAARTAYINYVSDYTASINDDAVRKDVKEGLLSQLPGVTNEADAYEQKVRLDTTKMRTNDSLTAARNKVLSDPTAYDESLALGREAIDVYGAKLNPPAREEMKTQWGYDVTKNRFQALLDGARTPQELDSVRSQMASDEWQSKLQPRDYEDLTAKATSAKRAYQTKASSEAKALVTNLNERSTDPTTFIPQEEIVQAQAAVTASGDIAEQAKLARVVRNQQIMKTYSKATPAQVNATIQQMKQTPSSTGLASEDATLINNAALKYDVPASFLENTGSRESSGKADAANPDSSALGWGQFTKDTFLSLVKDPATAYALGVRPGMTQEEILALRTDKAKSIEATAILAKQNKSQMEAALGRPISDSELYLAHFLGAGDATRFVQTMQTNPEASASAAFPKAAASNPGVFNSKAGTPLTVADVYNNISSSFNATSSRVAYDDIQVLQKLSDKMSTELKGPNGLKYAAAVGNITLTPLDQPGAFAARANSQATAETIYGQKFKPFTSDEEAYLQKTIDEGSVNDTLALLRNIQTAPQNSARAMFEQLNVKSPSFAHAGQLAISGDVATASDVVRGYKRWKENPAILSSMGYDLKLTSTDFNTAVGPALGSIPPDQRQAVQEAAVSLLVEKKQGATYSSNDYKDAVKRVLGNRLQTVNGDKTFLPAGLTSDDVEKALSKMTLNDYIGMSVQGAVPQHAGGGGLDPDEAADEIKLRAVGDDKYKLLDSDNAYVWTGRVVNGLPEPFLLDLKPERVRGILNRKVMAEAK